jgi:predicted nucleic acid-binding protein
MKLQTPPGKKRKGICRDSNDGGKLECGLLVHADYLITGDADLLILKNFQQIKIVTTSEYLQITDALNFS